MNIFDDKKGSTLVEVIMYVVLVASILTAVMTLVRYTNSARAKQRIEREVEEQGRQVLESILSTTRNGVAILLPAANSTGATLSVTVDSAPSSPTIFSLSGTAIQIKEGASAAVSLTNSNVTASALSISNLTRSSTPGTMRVSFTLTGAVVGAGVPYTYAQTFYGSASLR